MPRSEFAANLALQSTRQAQAWQQPSTCKRRQLSLIQRLVRFIAR